MLEKLNLSELSAAESADINGGDKEWLLGIVAAFPVFGVGSLVALGVYLGYNQK